MAKRFTLAQAESLLPELGRMLREAISLKRDFEESESSLQALAQKVMMSGGLVVDRERAVEKKATRSRAAERLKATLESIQEMGCVVKDLDIGLLDFPTLLRGREVYLCWKLGEPEIAWWHSVDEGFAGRKPIDEDFLNHHQGDPPH